jgi:hypothetical protein
LIRWGIEWELREGGSYCSGSVTGGRNGWRREMTGSAKRWGRVVSRRGRRERYRFGKGFLGCGLVSSSGPKGFPEALFLIFFSFLLFLFLFSYFFILFAKMLQTKSNHFQKFSKNQCNDLTLQETRFQNWNKIFKRFHKLNKRGLLA